MNMQMIFLFASLSSFLMKDSIDFLKLLALKGHKVSKENRSFPKPGFELGHLISTAYTRIPWNLNFPNPKTKCHCGFFLVLVDYYQNWIPNSLSYSPTSVSLDEESNPKLQF